MVPSLGLVIEIHGYGCMVYEVIRSIARAAPTQNLAINLRACKIDVSYQGCLVRGRLSHTPSFLKFHKIRSDQQLNYFILSSSYIFWE